MSLTLNTKVYNYRNTQNGVATYAEDSGQYVGGFSLVTARASIGQPSRGSPRLRVRPLCGSFHCPFWRTTTPRVRVPVMSSVPLTSLWKSAAMW